MAPESILLVVMHLSLTLYAILAGADFGAGVWELNLGFRTSDKEQRLIYKAIGPVWEANHVWLIFVLVLAANALPVAFAAVCRALWLPLLLTLVGIVLRGSAFAFRSYAVGAPRQQQLWDILFALASMLAPFFLGASIGAIAAGQPGVAADGSFDGEPLTDWLSPLSTFTAFFAVGTCVYLASFYLTREAGQKGDGELAKRWRARSLATGTAMGTLSLAGLAVVAFDAPLLWSGFRNRAWPLVILSLAAGFTSLAAMWKSRFTLAAVSAALTVAAVIWGWGVAQYPLLVPPELRVEGAKAPDNVIKLVLVATAAGGVILLPSLAYLLLLFKSRP